MKKTLAILALLAGLIAAGLAFTAPTASAEQRGCPSVSGAYTYDCATGVVSGPDVKLKKGETLKVHVQEVAGSGRADYTKDVPNGTLPVDTGIVLEAVCETRVAQWDLRKFDKKGNKIPGHFAGHKFTVSGDESLCEPDPEPTTPVPTETPTTSTPTPTETPTETPSTPTTTPPTSPPATETPSPSPSTSSSQPVTPPSQPVTPSRTSSTEPTPTSSSPQPGASPASTVAVPSPPAELAYTGTTEGTLWAGVTGLLSLMIGVVLIERSHNRKRGH